MSAARSFQLLLILSIALLPFRASADTRVAVAGATATAAISRPLTLIEFTDLALRNNPKTRLAWAAIRASEAGVEIARAGYWPAISANVSAQHNRALNFSGLPSDPLTRYSATITLSYLLWDFGVRDGRLDQAKFELTSAHLSQDQSIQNVILQVEQAYYQVLGLQAVLDANRLSLKDAETNLAAAQDRKASGLATLGDVFKAEAALAGAKLALQQTEGQLESARGQLATAIGARPDTALSLVAWEAEILPVIPSQSIESLLASARDARPELLASKARENAAAANVGITRGQGLPTLNFNANAGRTTVIDVGDSSQYSALLSLNVPLFSGFGERAALRQAEAQLETARATSEDLRSQVELQVWQAYQNLRTAAVTVDTSAAQLKSAQQAADVSSARYKSGLDTILDTLSTQTTLANARVQQVQARLNLVAARAALGHAVGGLRAPGQKMGSP